MNKSLYLIFILIYFVSCTEEKKKTVDVRKPTSENSLAKKESVDSLMVREYFASHQVFQNQESDVNNYYKNRNYDLVWSEKGKVTPMAGMFINMIEDYHRDSIYLSSAKGKGLREAYLIVNNDSNNYEGIDREKVKKELDVMLTSAFFKYSDSLFQDTTLQQYALADSTKRKFNSLNALLSKGDSSKSFKKPESSHKEFKLLKDALVKYQEIKQKGGWPSIELENKNELKKGDSGKEVASLTKRLQLTEDLKAIGGDSVFNEVVQKAVKKFQSRHGIKEDGVVAGKTLEELNVPVDKRIEQIEINMERWRWVPKMGEGKNIYVNIPAFALHAFNNGKEVLETEVIVGEEGKNTPVFKDKIEFIILNPYWYIPKSIAVNDILPLIKKNKNYISQNGIEVFKSRDYKEKLDASKINWEQLDASNFKYALRQKPGPQNELGKIKFLFPNNFNIYFHGTPHDYLFDKEERSLSHGCIRVNEPLKLADFLLSNDSKWNRSSIDKVLKNNNEEEQIKLKEKTPVLILYFTTWVDKKGNLQFREDIYGHDKDLAKSIN